MKFTFVALFAATLNARGSAKLTGTNQEHIKVCECDEATGLCGSTNKASDFKFGTEQTKKHDFFLEYGIDAGCCETGCKANCGGKQRDLANLTAESAKTIGAFCKGVHGKCPIKDMLSTFGNSPEENCAKASDVDVKNCVCTGDGSSDGDGNTYTCGVPGDDTTLVVFDGLETDCSLGSRCTCKMKEDVFDSSKVCKMVCGQVVVGDCFENMTSAPTSTPDGYYARHLKEDDSSGGAGRRNRALCINQECCASLAGGPPSCVPEGTCKIIHDYYLSKNGNQ